MKPKKHLNLNLRIPLWWPSFPANWRAILCNWLPSRGNVLFTLITVGVMAFASRAGALQAPASPATVPTSSSNTIPYQGRIANASGQAITGTQPMIFRLYNVASGGTHLWEEQWTGPNSVRVSDGLFNVMLGSLKGISQAIITGNPNLWLGITVGSDNEMTPRVQLGSVPFATQALTVPDGSITSAKLSPDMFIHKMTQSSPIATVIQSNTNLWCATNNVTYPMPFPNKTLMVIAWLNVTGTTYGFPVASPWVWDKNGFGWNSCFYYVGTPQGATLSYTALGY